jgi:hypothetical protein
MRYTLLTLDGKLYTFSVLECAVVFQQAYGGTLFTEAILVSEALDKSTVLV